MESQTAAPLQKLVAAMEDELWVGSPSYGSRQYKARSVQDLRGIESLLMLARPHEGISSAEYYEKISQILSLCRLLYSQVTELLPRTQAVAPPSLSIREIEVLRWSAEGKTAEDIGAILNLKERTINFHLGNAMKKMGATNKTSAVVQAILGGVL